MVKWGTAATGSFFRTLYNGGIWLSREEAQVAVENGWNSTDPKLEIKLVKAVESLSLVFFQHTGCSKEAFGAAASLASALQWALFYMRPKVHNMQHVVFPGCTTVTAVFVGRAWFSSVMSEGLPTQAFPTAPTGRPFLRIHLQSSMFWAQW